MKPNMDKTSKLKIGTIVPAFTAADSEGQPVTLADLKGRKTLLCFFRYASCPLCNLRVHKLSQVAADLGRRGIEIVAVFHSPQEQIQRYVGKQRPPFRIVADPELKLYQLFCIEQSRLAVFKGFILRFATSGLRAMARGYFPGDIDGTNYVVPADFLIDEELRVQLAYYGSDIGDHIPLADVTEFAAQTTR